MNTSPINGVQALMLDKMDTQAKIASNPFSEQSSVTRLNSVSESNLKIGSGIKGILDVVDSHSKDAESKIRAVELGLSDDLIGATIASQKASLSFSALMQVRNKMVSNFNDIIKMAI